MKLTKKDYFFIGLSIVSLLAHACLLPGMPDIVPTHWGFDGTVNGYSNKYVTLFLAALPCPYFTLPFCFLYGKGGDYGKGGTYG